MGVFIDLKKAFDTISHNLLLSKLLDVGVTGVAYDILKSFLTNRSQIVKIDKTESSPRKVTFGIPQGSILGPLLFLIYINNVHKIGLKGDVTLYADDTCLFYFGSSADTIITDAQADLNKLNDWLQCNLLTINTSKTNYIIFSAKNKKITHHPPLTINNKTITEVDSEKYLGLILDSHLTWKPHINKIKTKLTALTGLLKNITKCFPRQTRYILYNSLVKPHLDYLIEIWGTAAPTNLAPLRTSQNKLIKVLFNYDFLAPTDQIYKNTKLMNIEQSYQYFTCILVRKILNQSIKTQIHFDKNYISHNIKLRNSNDIKLIKPRTNYGKQNIMYDGAKVYNKIPNSIKDAKTLQTFKKLLKSYIINSVKK